MYQVCPVCGGKGTMPHGFYSGENDTMTTTVPMQRVPCRACGGSGVLYDLVPYTPSPIPYVPFNPYWPPNTWYGTNTTPYTLPPSVTIS